MSFLNQLKKVCFLKAAVLHHQCTVLVLGTTQKSTQKKEEKCEEKYFLTSLGKYRNA